MNEWRAGELGAEAPATPGSPTPMASAGNDRHESAAITAPRRFRLLRATAWLEFLNRLALSHPASESKRDSRLTVCHLD